uniref:Cysteine proteinase inhibitor n=1 Tax=Oryza brachyantha TaxID=4533 RepID=J3LKH9_ORYBR
MMRRTSSPSPSSSLLPLLVVAAALVAAALPAAEATYRPIANPNALVYQQVGRFSVIVYNLSHRKSLVFVSVVSGETEAAVGGGGGTSYRLAVAVAKPDGSAARYHCLVWGVPGSHLDTWQLRRFRRIQ